MINHQLQNTAILVFVRDELEEAKLKSFLSQRSLQKNLQVVRTLNRHVRFITRQSGFPTFIIKGAQQVGTTFGERFANAVESVLNSGYEQIITIGNDCLSLNAAQLQEMAAQLSNGAALVLGPAKDGGAYAIGIQRNAFFKADFLALPWQTEHVFAALVNYANQFHLTYTCLATAADVDDVTSFHLAMARLSPVARLYRLLRNILQLTRLQSVVDISIISNLLSFISLLRAPPPVFLS